MLKTSTVIKQPPKMLDVALLMADIATATRHGQTHASVCQRWTTETVFAFAHGEIVCQIAGGDNVSVEGLAESGAF